MVLPLTEAGTTHLESEHPPRVTPPVKAGAAPWLEPGDPEVPG